MAIQMLFGYVSEFKIDLIVWKSKYNTTSVEQINSLK